MSEQSPPPKNRCEQNEQEATRALMGRLIDLVELVRTTTPLTEEGEDFEASYELVRGGQQQGRAVVFYRATWDNRRHYGLVLSRKRTLLDAAGGDSETTEPAMKLLFQIVSGRQLLIRQPDGDLQRAQTSDVAEIEAYLGAVERNWHEGQLVQTIMPRSAKS